MEEKNFRRNRAGLMYGYASHSPSIRGRSLAVSLLLLHSGLQRQHISNTTASHQQPQKSCFAFSCLTDTKLAVSLVPRCQRGNSSILRRGWYQTLFGQSAVFLLCPGSQGDDVLLTAAVEPWHGTILGRYAATRTSIWQLSSSLSCFRVSEVVRFSSVSN